MQLLRRYRFISSRLTTIELRSVFKRKHSDGDIDSRAYDAIARKLESDRSKWELVALSAAILDSAESLVNKHDIRTLDAIHLASAMTVNERLGGKLPFVTADLRQSEAATKLGFNLVWIE